jgi:hypothetical protein
MNASATSTANKGIVKRPQKPVAAGGAFGAGASGGDWARLAGGGLA